MERKLSPLGVLNVISEDEAQNAFPEEPFEHYQEAARKLIDDDKYKHRNQWMAEVHDKTPLYTINIPGTRDSLHGHTATIMDQLNAGIRFIDVRAHVEPQSAVLTEEQKKDVSCYCIQVSGDSGWCEFQTTVLHPCLAFLTANPTETVVMLVTVGEPIDPEFPNVSDVFLTNYVTERSDWVFDSANPAESNPMLWTMQGCRGKIVLITRGDWNNLSSPDTRSLEFPEHLDANGIFEKEEMLYGFTGDHGPYDKAARVISKISEVMLSTPNAVAPDQPVDKTIRNVYNKFYLTFVSGFAETEPPPINESVEEEHTEDTSAVEEKGGDFAFPMLSLEPEEVDEKSTEATVAEPFMRIVNLYLTEFLMVSLIRSRRVGWIILDKLTEDFDHLIGLVIRSNDQMFERPPRLTSLWLAPPMIDSNAEVENPELTGEKVFENICTFHGRFTPTRGLINVGFGERIVQRDNDLEVQWLTNEVEVGEECGVELDGSKTLCGVMILCDIIRASDTWGIKNIRGIYTDGSTSNWVTPDFEETPTTRIYSKILMYGVTKIRAVYIPQVGLINLAVG